MYTANPFFINIRFTNDRMIQIQGCYPVNILCINDALVMVSISDNCDFRNPILYIIHIDHLFGFWVFYDLV
jgi:hypothetical protein